MGDAQVFVKTATYNADVAAFFTKWLIDVTADGQFTLTTRIPANTTATVHVPAKDAPPNDL